MKTFLDTNILAYAIDPRDQRKRDRARQCMADVEKVSTVVISTQVMLELHSVLTAKLRMDSAQSRALVQATSLRYEVVTLTADLILRGLDVHIINKISHWDACIVMAAASAGCKELMSEDMQHGAIVEGVRIRNPFNMS
ncbi:MAG: PIN domain-containing protein [Planctomycetota bacterium]